MTENQILALAWPACLVARIPRIVERWRAPFLNGAGWFFGIQVAPDFMETTGRAILAKYRLRLFVPWAIEIPLSAMLLVTGHPTAILALVMIVTLLTRVAYYANRKTAEDTARRFQIPQTAKPVASVTLCLHPRSLRDYTNWWIEAAIATPLLGSLAWLAYSSFSSGDWHPLRVLWAVALIFVYLQFGLLLAKRGLVRARSVAPAENAESYLVWRESLRRLSTTVCDCMRLAMVPPPLIAFLPFLAAHFERRSIEIAMVSLVAASTIVLGSYEWRRRMQHLKVTRQTKPTELLVRPDSSSLQGFVCFRPSLPMLLLRGPNGYALNLASAPARTAGLYFAGCAALLMGLMR